MTSASKGGDLSPLQSALQSWRAFDLTARRPHLDNAAQSLIDAKETSAKARRHLAELTKNLKRAVKSAENDAGGAGGGGAAVNDLATQCRTTIKAYQDEVDSLTRRCKSAEGSFVGLYRPLHECPDPAEALGEALRLVEGRDGQVNNLLKAMEELNEEVEGSREDTARLEADLRERERELAEARKDGGGGGGSDVIPGGALSLAEREELIRLRGEVAEYEVEFRGLKNQDITIRKLESKIEELEENKEEEIQKELKKAQEELAESEGRRAADALEREAATSRRLESVELQLRAERAGREASATQLLRAEDGLGEREAAWEAQRQILVQDAERLREELGEACRERDTCRLRMEALGAPPSSGNFGTVGLADGLPPTSGGVKLAEYMRERKAFEAEISELSNTCNALREELRTKEDSISKERKSLRTTLDTLEREHSSLSKKASSLELQVANAPSQDVVDKMRHELRILKRLEYNALDLDLDRDHPEMTPDAGNDDDLESVLVAKLHRAEADLVRERREKSEGLRACDELNLRLISMQKSLDDAEGLIASLENDLQLAVATPAAPAAPSGGDIPYGSIDPPDPHTLQTILDPSAPPVGNPLPAKRGGTGPPAVSETARDDHSVATIVMAQRDRLRARCDALEAERDGFKRELQAQVQSADGLRGDNTKLYEKVRYLQSFNGSGASGGSRLSAHLRGRGGGSDRDLDLEALEQRYEASVDPFRQFNRAERQRKFNEMSPMEKIVFIVAKTTLGSKEMRTTLFFYVLAMHLLVFVTTYHWSHSSTCDTFLQGKDAYAHLHGGPPLLEAANGVAVAANAAAAVAANAAVAGTNHSLGPN